MRSDDAAQKEQQQDQGDITEGEVEVDREKAAEVSSEQLKEEEKGTGRVLIVVCFLLVVALVEPFVEVEAAFFLCFSQR